MRFHIGYSFKLKHLKWLFLALFGLLSFSGIFDLSKKDLNLISKVYAEENLETYYNIDIFEQDMTKTMLTNDMSLQDFLSHYYNIAKEPNSRMSIQFRFLNDNFYQATIIYTTADSLDNTTMTAYVDKSYNTTFYLDSSNNGVGVSATLKIIKGFNNYSNLTILYNDVETTLNEGMSSFELCKTDNSTCESGYHRLDSSFYADAPNGVSNSSNLTLSFNALNEYYYYFSGNLTYSKSTVNSYYIKDFQVNNNSIGDGQHVPTYCDIVDCDNPGGGGDNPGGGGDNPGGGGDNPGGETTIEDLENTILDNTPPDVPTFGDIEISSDSAISGLLLLPITLLQRLNNSIGGTCTPYTIPFGLTGGSETLTFPCIVLEDYLGSNLVQIIDLAICLFLIYEVAMLIISSFESITSLEDGFASLYTPRHARPIGKHTKEVD